MHWTHSNHRKWLAHAKQKFLKFWQSSFFVNFEMHDEFYSSLADDKKLWYVSIKYKKGGIFRFHEIWDEEEEQPTNQLTGKTIWNMSLKLKIRKMM